jgi:hypothetical protein
MKTGGRFGRSFFFVFLFFPSLNITFAFYSIFINENCWKKKNLNKVKSVESRKQNIEGAFGEKEEIRKKPTDNKQHNSDLKGDFQSSHGLIECRGEMKKRAKGMFCSLETTQSAEELFGVRKPQTEQYLKGLNEGS